MLQVNDIHTYYGLAYILQGVSLSLDEREAVALLGRNGGGKSTTLKSIMSLVPPKRGKILYDGEDITGLSPYLVARKGISMVPEGRSIFPALSVEEHLRVPVSPPGVARGDLFERAFDIFPELKDKKSQAASSLSGGQQQMLVIARSLMARPKLLLLDEPMEGLAPIMARRVIEAMKTIQAEGLTILLASTNCERAFAIASRAYIIEKGKMVYDAPKDDVLNNREVQQCYLGVRE